MHEFDRRTFLRLSGLAALAPHLELLPPLLEADHSIRIRRTTLELAPGRLVHTCAYDGQFPGPLLRLKAGQAAVIDIQNETDSLQWLRWHGQDVPVSADDDRFSDALRIPARGHRLIAFTPRESGLQLYHSNQGGGSLLEAAAYGAQAGPMLIEPRHDPGRFDREAVLVLKDFEPRLYRGARGFEIRYALSSINSHMLGHGEPIRVRAGERVLFHVLNASATEIRQLALPGHLFRVLSLDGHSVPRPAEVSSLRLGVGERVSALVRMNQPGVWIFGELTADDRDRGLGIVVEYAGCSGPPRWVQPVHPTWNYARFGAEGGCAPDEIIPLSLGTTEAARSGFNQWTVNGTAFSLRDGGLCLRLRVGRRYRLKLRNQSDVAHCLHLPGHRFELARSGEDPAAGVLKEVVTLDARQNLELDVVPGRPGPALLHCCRQLHRDFGLATRFEVT